MLAPNTSTADLFDVETEQAILGSCLVDNRQINVAAGLLEAEHFGDPLHARIFDMMVVLSTEGNVTPLILHSVMRSDQGLIEVGGKGYLATLAMAAPALPNVRDLARIIRDYAGRRALFEVGQSICVSVHQLGAKSVDQLFAEAAGAIGGEAEQFSRPSFAATPFDWIPPEDIPTRKWLFASRHAIAGHASATGAFGGTGKSSLIAAELLAHVTGRNLLTDAPLFRGRAWLLGLEDSRDEHRRRIAGAALLHKIDPAEFDGRLFLDTADRNFVVARQNRDGLTVAEPLVAGIIKEMKAREITLLVVDPFVASHAVPENDNSAIDTVARLWVRVAQETNAAVELVHHLRKGNGGGEPSADDFRGAGSLVPAVRSARVLATMDAADAEKLGVTERFRYFRVIDAKRNMAARDTETRWREITAMRLKNGTPDDHVAAVGPWTPPNPADDVTQEQLQALKAKMEGGPWREDVRAKAWVGNPVADVMGLDLKDPGGRKAAQRAVDQFRRVGILRIVDGRDERRKPCKFVIAV